MQRARLIKALIQPLTLLVAAAFGRESSANQRLILLVAYQRLLSRESSDPAWAARQSAAAALPPSPALREGNQ